MKPWEETWRQSEAYPEDVFGREGGDILFEGVECSDQAHSHARAQLAAAAPEMARLLLELEWDHAECNICGGTHEHESDCRLVAVLRKAGVLRHGEDK